MKNIFYKIIKDVEREKKNKWFKNWEKRKVKMKKKFSHFSKKILEIKNQIRK